MARKRKESNNQTNIDYQNIIHDNIDYYFFEFCNVHGLEDPHKITNSQFKAALIYINNHVFRNDKSLLYKNGNTLDLFKVNALCDRYIYLSYSYNQPVNLMGFSLISGINYTNMCMWYNNTKPMYINESDLLSADVYINNINDCNNDNKYNSNGAVAGSNGKMVTISRQAIYEKIINHNISSADSIALSKSGVNSIAYANRVHDKYSKRKRSIDTFIPGSIADRLGISADVKALEDKNKRENKRKKDNKTS